MDDRESWKNKKNTANGFLCWKSQTGPVETTHVVDQEQHVTFWWDCGKKTVQHNSNFVLLVHAYESISESDSAFCRFWCDCVWGARSTTLIATEHFVDPKKWLHNFGNPYQIKYSYPKHFEKEIISSFEQWCHRCKPGLSSSSPRPHGGLSKSR